MRRPVTWAREALDDMREQIAFIAEDNPAAARRVADRLRDTGEALGEIATGRPGRVTGTYEKSVTRLPYIISYELRSIASRESVVILRVIHTARYWPVEEWPH
ncbi:type II toxin-antitoxin system RelE/ParE family toxin [Rhizobium lemnae]|uniref:Type II toxin-antitoxin system RelE/ParE family toxin n=1 Tax=Rhizobium lemnae TaxID=1214924 RepID=A0ABV8EEJ7_9HYPH|nr:type II toxin-antitoxin system RelE/ParE family toxin [Rhizobium lemnae]